MPMDRLKRPSAARPGRRRWDGLAALAALAALIAVLTLATRSDSAPADQPTDQPTATSAEPTAEAPIAAAAPALAPEANLLKNGSFETPAADRWYGPWEFSADQASGARTTVSEERADAADGSVAFQVDVSAATPAQPWQAQLFQRGLPLTAGTPVTISFQAKAAKPRPIGVALSGTDFQVAAMPLTTAWQTFRYTFTPSTTGTTALTFNFAQDTGAVWLDAAFFGPAPQARLAAPSAPPTDAIYLGVSQHPAPWDMTALDRFRQDSGRGVAILSYFVEFQAGTPPERSWLTAVQTAGAVPMISWEWKQTNLAGVLSGAYDKDARLWAWALRDYGQPVLLRWGHEMNFPGYPWSVGVQGNTPEQYVAAWQRLREIFWQEGADNVQFVWGPNIIGGAARDFTAMFPGEKYVDWIALDGYNWATLNPWRSFTELFRDSYATITALSSKPLMIAEWGSTEAGGDKGAWLRSALTTEIPTSFPRIRAVVYFNQNYQEDWRIETSPGAKAGYAAGVASPLYRSTWP